MDNELLYGLSHDLASLVGSSKVFIKDLQNPESASMLEGNINKLDSISRGLTKLSRINSDNKRLVVNITESIKYAASKLKDMPKFSININEQEFTEITVIPTLLEEALFQIFHNAVVFSKNKTAEININLKMTGYNFCIEITDSCHKIPDDKLEFVFGPFKILEKRGDRNCGLGLYIARAAINRLKGSVYFEKTNADGNKLLIVLPFEEV